MRARLKIVPASDHALLGAYVRSIRVKAGLSQLELSQALHVPQSFISKIERGERQMQLIEFVLVCRQLGLEPAAALATFLEDLPVLSTLSTARVSRLPK